MHPFSRYWWHKRYLDGAFTWLLKLSRLSIEFADTKSICQYRFVAWWTRKPKWQWRSMWDGSLKSSFKTWKISMHWINLFWPMIAALYINVYVKCFLSIRHFSSFMKARQHQQQYTLHHTIKPMDSIMSNQNHYGSLCFNTNNETDCIGLNV